MEQYNMDLAVQHGVEHGDDELDFGFESQTSSASSARSFSTAPSCTSCAPITPPSGRATPMRSTPSGTFESSAGYELAPSSSSFALDDFFTAEVKVELSEGLLSTPPKEDLRPSYNNMNFEHANILNSALPSLGSSMDLNDVNPLDQYPFEEQMASSHFDVVPASYSLDPHYHTAMWHFQAENSMILMDKRDSPADALPARHDYRAHERNALLPSTPSDQQGSSRRRQPAANTQVRRNMLHRVQGSPRVLKQDRPHSRSSSHDHLVPDIHTYPAGSHRCDYPECVGRNGYKRKEHLLRHKKSYHKEQEPVFCVFCGHEFNRRDNYRQHLKLHATDGRPIIRTPYYEGAKEVLEKEEMQTKQRLSSKKKGPSQKRDH